MKTIEERADSYIDDCSELTLSETIVAKNAYIQGAKDQKKIDDETSDQVISVKTISKNNYG